MQVHRRGSRGSVSGQASIVPACAVGIGVFDGVHRGHQTLLQRVVDTARSQGIPAVAYTFDPHPAAVLRPASAPKLIDSVDARMERFAAMGIDLAVIEPFSLPFSRTTARSFAADILSKSLGAQYIFVGEDFTFGYQQAGNLSSLREWGKELGFVAEAVPLLTLGDIPVTSSKVREYVWAGEVRGAGMLLGRPHQITGVVTRGAGRGKGLGFATANIKTHAELIPAHGVYAVWAHGPFGIKQAVMSIGNNPTFGEQGLHLEVHVLDYSGEPLYGAVMAVDFIQRLRGEEKFFRVEALVEQMHRDVAQAREILAQSAPPA
jgi:riboflavin kinase/FMN adenylyltransferase